MLVEPDEEITDAVCVDVLEEPAATIIRDFHNVRS